MDNQWKEYCAQYDKSDESQRQSLRAALSDSQRPVFDAAWAEYQASPPPPPLRDTFQYKPPDEQVAFLKTYRKSSMLKRRSMLKDYTKEERANFDEAYRAHQAPEKRKMAIVGVIAFLGFAVVMNKSDNTVHTPPSPQPEVGRQGAYTPNPNHARHQILKRDSINRDTVHRVRVRIYEPLKEADLSKIGKAIKRASPGFERYYIFFHYKGPGDGAAYATTHFDPDFKVDIFDKDGSMGL